MSAVLVDVEVLVERIAQRVVELLVERGHDASGRTLVDATELARLLGISRSTVYDNAARLEGVQVGNGAKRPRLRFDPIKAREAWTHHSGAHQGVELPAPAPVRRRRRDRSLASGVELLPVKGNGAA